MITFEEEKDMMTIEEMINLLEEVIEFDDFFQYNPRYLEDFNIMIETLKQLQSKAESEDK